MLFSFGTIDLVKMNVFRNLLGLYMNHLKCTFNLHYGLKDQKQHPIS